MVTVIIIGMIKFLSVRQASLHPSSDRSNSAGGLWNVHIYRIFTRRQLAPTPLVNIDEELAVPQLLVDRQGLRSFLLHRSQLAPLDPIDRNLAVRVPRFLQTT